jgi:DNA polymerase III epsilon subunit-like protein
MSLLDLPAVRRPSSKLFERFRVVCWDLETTHRSPAHARILQIGARSSCGESFVSLVDPRCRIPPEATRVHGITAQKVARAPAFPAAWERFVDFVKRVSCGGEAAAPKPVLLVGHNSWAYDEAVVRQELLRCGLQESERHRLPRGSLSADTLRAARQARKQLVLGKGAPLALTKLHDRFYQEDELMRSAHDALTDATAVLKLLRRAEIRDFVEPREWLGERPGAAQGADAGGAADGDPEVDEAGAEAGAQEASEEGAQEASEAGVPASGAPDGPASLPGEAEAGDARKRRKVASARFCEARRLPVCEGCGCAFSLHFRHECSGERRAPGEGTETFMPPEDWWQKFEWRDPSEPPLQR